MNILISVTIFSTLSIIILFIHHSQQFSSQPSGKIPTFSRSFLKGGVPKLQNYFHQLSSSCSSLTSQCYINLRWFIMMTRVSVLLSSDFRLFNVYQQDHPHRHPHQEEVEDQPLLKPVFSVAAKTFSQLLLKTSYSKASHNLLF